MEPTLHAPVQEPARSDVSPSGGAQGASAAPRLDLSRMEPPRKLEELRLEEVTIDGICGVY